MTTPSDIDTSSWKKNKANHWALTPISFLERTNQIWPEKTAWIHGSKSNTYKELRTRCLKIARGLIIKGIKKGDTVAAILPNVPAMIECHFSVMMAGAILNTINTRLDSKAINFILQHGKAKMIFVDPEFDSVIAQAIREIPEKKRPLIIKCKDEEFIKDTPLKNEITNDDLANIGDKESLLQWPENEWDACSLNYTSGTTGDPKGVLYHHRGAWLTAIGNQMVWSMGKHPIYLWTLPMFHCNGWCFPWTITAMAGTHICLRNVTAKNIYNSLTKHNVTHMCGAPIILSMIINAKKNEIQPIDCYCYPSQRECCSRQSVPAKQSCTAC